jgi:hypothetical protein
MTLREEFKKEHYFFLKMSERRKMLSQSLRSTVLKKSVLITKMVKNSYSMDSEKINQKRKKIYLTQLSVCSIFFKIRTVLSPCTTR